jgi:hypothetical protein
MAGSGSNVGVFVDAENLPPRVVQRVMDIAGVYGRIVERRIYGDFTQDSLRPWAEIAAHHALSLQTAQATTSGKNSSDILLSIDVTELMCRSNLDVYCLVTCDSDFIHLASRLRMLGHTVIGIGGNKASTGLRVAFDEFFEVDVESRAAVPRRTGKVVALKRTGDIRPYIVQALNLLQVTPGDWVEVARLATAIRQLNPEFQTKNFGSAKFSTVLKNCDFVELRNEGTVRMQARVNTGVHGIVRNQGEV